MEKTGHATPIPQWNKGKKKKLWQTEHGRVKLSCLFQWVISHAFRFEGNFSKFHVMVFMDL